MGFPAISGLLAQLRGALKESGCNTPHPWCRRRGGWRPRAPTCHLCTASMPGPHFTSSWVQGMRRTESTTWRILLVSLQRNFAFGPQPQRFCIPTPNQEHLRKAGDTHGFQDLGREGSGCCCSVTQSCLSVTPRTAALQAPLSFAVSQSFLKFMSVELVMLSNHLILCWPLLLPSIFPSIKVFSSESTLRIRWPKYLLELQLQSFQ